ncbi:AEC family transporter [Olivibacter jilunii]|uniref:AEC family transporter n=1 Tax=Olivibacter jilunii TaxID=985016 RepID=UPI003F18B158
MELLQELLNKVLPLYGFILIGFFAKKRWQLGSKWISKILLYLLIPLLIIENMLQAELSESAVVGSIIFVLALAMNIPAIICKRFVAKDFNGSLLKGSFSYYNIGWFGIPVVMALFGNEQMPLIISAYVGNVFYGDTLGYYLISRTKGLPVKEAAKNVFRIPALYACVIAVLLNLFSVNLPQRAELIGDVVGWTVSASGMFIIGLTLADINFQQIRLWNFAKILGLRYISAAVLLVLLLCLEKQFMQILDDDKSKLMGLIASFPIAANLVVFASFLETEKKNSALLVGISSIISLVLVPILCLLLF